jgi:hypothetical protein
MPNYARLGSLLLLLTLFVGCATLARAPKYSESKVSEPKPGYAVLYIFREDAAPTAFGATIYIDDREVGTLNQGCFTWIYAKPGSRRMMAVWSVLAGQVDAYLKLDIAESKTYYVEVSGEISLARDRGIPWSGLNEVNPEAAEVRLVKCCKFQKPVELTY